MKPKSYDVRAPGALKLFAKSQLTKAQLPPKGTTFQGQTVLLTGGNAGLGYGCAEWLVELNVSRIILAVRTPSKGEAAAAKLRQKSSKVEIDVWQLDMESYESVQALAKQCEALDRLDIAILNAGASDEKFSRSGTGHERLMQVNYYSTVLLSFLLLPILKAKSPAGKPGRLTVVNSGTALAARLQHRYEKPLLAAYDDESKFNPYDHYASTKAFAHFWILKLIEHVKKGDVVVNLVDPGMVKGTDLLRDLTGVNAIAFGVVKALTARNIRNGSSTYIDAVAVQGPESHGCFVMDWKINAYPSAIHEKRGEEIIQRVWNETLDELSFANVRDILERL